MSRRIAVSVLFVLFACVARPVNAADDDEPKAIIDRAVQAAGGAAKIREIKGMSFHARFMDDKKPILVSGLVAEPILFRLDIKLDKDDSLLLVGGGDSLWEKSNKGSVEEMHIGNDNSDQFKATTRFFYCLALTERLLALKGKDYHLSSDGERGVNGVNADAIIVKHRESPDVILYFDKGTGLPVKSQIVDSEKGKKENTIDLFGASDEMFEFFFDDYKEFDGIKHYTKLTVRMGKTQMEYQLRDIKFLKQLDPNTFKKPK